MTIHKLNQKAVPKIKRPNSPMLELANHRKKPRLRVLQTGECQYQFATLSWIVLQNPQAAYHHLGSLLKPVHNTNW